ncbi:MAG: PEGA domain-containing protein, partial [Candidatus Poribacteria bacterium]
MTILGTSAQTGIDDNGFALLIDVSDYKDTKIPPLLPRSDLDKIKKALVSAAGFPDRQVYMVSGQNATREGITEVLTIAVNSAKSNTNAHFLLYFRGRSLRSQSINYFLPYDARIGAISTYIEENEFERWLNQTSFGKSFIQLGFGMDTQDSKGFSSLLANILSDDQADSDGDRNITLGEIETKIRGDYPVRISGSRSNVIIRLPSALIVNTQPPGASIILDGIEKGKSPAKITNLTLGTHRLLIKKNLYRIPEEKTVEVISAKGQTISVSVYQLTLIKVYGVVKFPNKKPINNIEVRIGDTGYRQKINDNMSFSFGDWQAYGMLEPEKTYSLIAQSSDGMYTGRTSFSFSGTEDLKLDIPLKEENWIDTINRLLQNGDNSAANDILNSMIQSYEQGESNLFIEESSTNMPASLISLLLRNVEEKLTSKPDDVRLQFLAAKLADFNGDNDLAKQHWLAVKINASKDSDEYKQ